MFKTQLRFQKILSMAMLIFGAVVFIYALGLMTDIYGALFFAYEPEFDIEYVSGAKLFHDMQDFNKQLLTCSIVLILAALTLFITGVNSRRKYYIGNYISTFLCGGANIAVSVFAIINLIEYRTRFLQVDFEALKKRAETVTSIIYTESTFWFDLGFVLCALMFVAAGLLVFNLIWKIKLMKKEDSLLNSNKEVA